MPITRKRIQVALAVFLTLFQSVPGLAETASKGMANEGATDGGQVCVLNFERPNHPISAVVRDVFENAPGARIYANASPSQLLDCVRGGYPEILIIGHAIETPATRANSPVNLGYFPEIPRSERDAGIQAEINRISAELKGGTPSADALKQLEWLKELLRSDERFYSLAPILPRAFSRMREELSRRVIEPGSASLRKIRLMSCLPEQVLKQYPALRALIAEHGIELDIAPPNPIMSYIEGKQVTSPDLDWLAKSVDCSKLRKWRTEKNHNCSQDWWPGCDRQEARLCLPEAPAD